MKIDNTRSNDGAAFRGDRSPRRAGSAGIRVITSDGRIQRGVQSLRVPRFQELPEDESLLFGEGAGAFTNDTGDVLPVGSVVVLVGATVIETTTPQDTRSIGVVIVAAVDGDEAIVQTAGIVDLVLVTAAVTAGNFGETSTVAGQATENATRRAGSFCMFLTSGTTPSAVLFGMPDSAVATATGGEMVPYYIPVDETFTVPLYKQALFYEPIEVDGALVVNGLLQGVD